MWADAHRATPHGSHRRQPVLCFRRRDWIWPGHKKGRQYKRGADQGRNDESTGDREGIELAVHKRHGDAQRETSDNEAHAPNPRLQLTLRQEMLDDQDGCADADDGVKDREMRGNEHIGATHYAVAANLHRIPERWLEPGVSDHRFVPDAVCRYQNT